MADVKEACSLESIAEMSNLGIPGSEASKPIVGDANGWDDLSLAAVFKHSFSEDGNLLDDVSWLSVWIWAWENISVVKENYLDSFDHTLMDAEGESSADAHMNVINVMNSRWIISQVASLSLSIPLVVWRDDNDILSKVGQTDR
jgi:hypothetical protein